MNKQREEVGLPPVATKLEPGMVLGVDYDGIDEETGQPYKVGRAGTQSATGLMGTRIASSHLGPPPRPPRRSAAPLSATFRPVAPCHTVRGRTHHRTQRRCRAARSADALRAPPPDPARHRQEHDFKPPQLTDEENEYSGLPRAQRCDVCRAVAWELQQVRPRLRGPRGVHAGPLARRLYSGPASTAVACDTVRTLHPRAGRA